MRSGFTSHLHERSVRHRRCVHSNCWCVTNSRPRHHQHWGAGVFVCHPGPSSIRILVTSRCFLKNFPCALAKSAFHGRLRRSSTRVFVCHRLRSAKTRCRRCPSSRRLALRPRRTGALSPRVSSGVFSLLAEVRFHLGDPISLRAGGVPPAAG